MTILCDITEFVARPIRTGIQRVSYEIISRWNGDQSLVPICLTESDEFVRLPAECFQLMKRFFQEQNKWRLKRIQSQIQNLVDHPETVVLDSFDGYSVLFTPEVFFCHRRIDLYREIATENFLDVFLVVYDFLPWIHPEYFQEDMSLGTYRYLRLLRDIPHLAYISEWSRKVADERVFRGQRDPGVTIPLGTDGLGSAPPRFDARLKTFSVVSTIEPRKGHLLVLDAFERLWQQGHTVPLTFVGRQGWLSPNELARIERLQKEEPLFTWQSGLTDPQVREVILESRATIYLSRQEGFGLPPVESLALGKPVIVSAHIPSIDMLPPHGQIRLANPTVESLQSAIVALSDDEQALAKTEEIRKLDLLTWDDASQLYADWIATNASYRYRSKAA